MQAETLATVCLSAGVKDLCSNSSHSGSLRAMRQNSEKLGARTFKYPKCIVETMSNPVYNIMQSTTSRALEIGTEVPRRSCLIQGF